MKVLIVGCGAVGQVYALSLQKAGVQLGLYDLPATRQKLQQALGQGGMYLFELSRQHRRAPIEHRLSNYQIAGDETQCRDLEPDQIWFTIPSQVYYSDWFHDFLKRVPSSRVVCFIPEGSRTEIIPEGENDRFVFAGTTFMAWQSDLEGGGGRPEGVNFWLPPLGIPLIGTQNACVEVKQVLNRAGFKVSIGKPGSHAQASTTALMTAFIAGLELAGWSLKLYRSSPWLKCAARASREAMRSQYPSIGLLQRLLTSNTIMWIGFYLVALILPFLFPFDIEKYLKFHYRKTRDQTLVLLNLFISDAQKVRGQKENIQTLLEALRTRV
jgi:hypothetical protein